MLKPLKSALLSNTQIHREAISPPILPEWQMCRGDLSLWLWKDLRGKGAVRKDCSICTRISPGRPSDIVCNHLKGMFKIVKTDQKGNHEKSHDPWATRGEELTMKLVVESHKIPSSKSTESLHVSCQKSIITPCIPCFLSRNIKDALIFVCRLRAVSSILPPLHEALLSWSQRYCESTKRSETVPIMISSNILK